MKTTKADRSAWRYRAQYAIDDDRTVTLVNEELLALLDDLDTLEAQLAKIKEAILNPAPAKEDG